MREDHHTALLEHHDAQAMSSGCTESFLRRENTPLDGSHKPSSPAVVMAEVMPLLRLNAGIKAERQHFVLLGIAVSILVHSALALALLRPAPLYHQASTVTEIPIEIVIETTQEDTPPAAMRQETVQPPMPETAATPEPIEDEVMAADKVPAADPLAETVSEPPRVDMPPAVAEPESISAPPLPLPVEAQVPAESAIKVPPAQIPEPPKARPHPVAAQRSQQSQKISKPEPDRRPPPAQPAKHAPPAASAADLAAFSAAVAGRVQAAKRYPESARSRGGSGTVIVSFSIGPGGQLARVSLARSSGQSDLDSEALETVRRAAPFPMPPMGAPLSFSIPLGFRLR